MTTELRTWIEGVKRQVERTGDGDATRWKMLGFIDDVLSRLDRDRQQEAALDEAVGRLVGVAGSIAAANERGNLDPKHPYFWPDLDAAIKAVNAARLSSSATDGAGEP